METGFYQISNNDYHKEEAVSKSDLELFHRSPAHLKAKELQKDTPALVFGAFYHTFILQPELSKKTYIQGSQELDGRTKEGKAFLEGRAYLKGISFKPNTGEKPEIVISWDDWQKVETMKKALESHSTAWALLSGEGPREISGFWIDKNTGLECKLRADFINSGNHIVGDLKTTVDARIEPFMKQIANLHYHQQGSHYLAGVSEITGIEHRDFVIIAQEKEPPYAVAVYRLDDPAIYLAQEELKILLAHFRECKETNNWPAYSDSIQPIGIPDWYLKKAEI